MFCHFVILMIITSLHISRRKHPQPRALCLRSVDVTIFLASLVAIFELVNLRSFANDNDIQPAHVIKRLIDSITRFSNFDCATSQ